MKSCALFAFLSFLLFAFTTTTTTAQVVIDTDGQIALNGGRYYLNPIGSGITFAKITDADSDSCRLAVVDAPFNGGRAMILQTMVLPAVLLTNTPIGFFFTDMPSKKCTNDSSWVVTRSASGGMPVMVGSAKEFGDAVVHGSFLLKFVDVVDDKYFYKVVFCEALKEECKNIGIHFDSQHLRRLVVTDKEPLIFKVRNAQSSFSSGLSKAG